MSPSTRCCCSWRSGLWVVAFNRFGRKACATLAEIYGPHFINARLDHLPPGDRFRFLPCTDQCISCSAGLLRRPLGCSVPLYVCMCPYAGCLTLLLYRFPIGSPAGCKLYI